VALVASEGAVEGGWAGGAALALARSWGEAGEKVIVVDGALHYPTLHTNAETDNFEGLSDAALFGLSVGRVAKRMDGGAYFLITAGTAVADANTVARSPRWGALLGGFLEAGVKLLLFVRDGDSGCAAFLGSASDIVVLAEKSEGPPAVVRDLEGMVRAVVGPAEVAVVTASTPSPAPAPPPPEVGRPEVGWAVPKWAVPKWALPKWAVPKWALPKWALPKWALPKCARRGCARRRNGRWRGQEADGVSPFWRCWSSSSFWSCSRSSA
jgi:hypothetical protein